MGMAFAWKPDSRFKIGAQIVGERLEAIKAERGEITPRAVVDDARSANSPLHKLFTWDDAKAADYWRIEEARKVIGSIVIAKVDGATVARETRAFVHISTGGERYEPIQQAMAVKELRDEVLARAQQEILNWRARYSAYQEFAEVHAAIDETFAEKAAKKPGRARRGMALEAVQAR